MTRLVRPILVACAALTLFGCGSGNDVGNSGLLNFKATPTPTAAQTATPTAAPTPTPAPTVVPVQRTAPPTAPPRATAPPTASKFNISIEYDNNPPIFNPPLARVYQGTIIVWTNHDTVARSVVANNGAFNSGSIPPGATYSYQATSVGTYDYSDGTRPYAVAQFQVLAH